MRLLRPVLLCVLAGALLPGAAAASHHVVPGETLSGIAAANGVSTSALAAANGLDPDAFAIAGTTLTIPAPGTSSGTSAGRTHLVAPGQTLSGIAAANGLTTQALAAANGIPADAHVIAGARLGIPAPGSGAGTVTAPAPAPLAGYRVRVGDTLSAIAAEHGLSLATLASHNGLDPDGVLLAGASLRLPGAGWSAPATTAEPSTSGGPQAVGGRLDAASIRSIAAAQGAPGALAAAIAWQESGFNNSMRSVADARGIMQVIPSSWDYVEDVLLGGRSLDPASPSDNVRAGSLLLADLLRKTGDEATAIAAYYQGLGSVRRIGMLPETRVYVSNVQALKARFGA